MRMDRHTGGDAASRSDFRGADRVPCRTCGNDLDFNTTDGMGRIVEQCPVCDWGWKPARDYHAFTRRRAAIATPTDTKSTPANQRNYTPRTCDICSAEYKPHNARQRYCSIPCKDEAMRRLFAERSARARRQRQCGCGAFLPLGSVATYCAGCKSMADAENKRRQRAAQQQRQGVA